MGPPARVPLLLRVALSTAEDTPLAASGPLPAVCNIREDTRCRTHVRGSSLRLCAGPSPMVHCCYSRTYFSADADKEGKKAGKVVHAASAMALAARQSQRAYLRAQAAV